MSADIRVAFTSNDREIYSSDIAFLLLSADSAMGQRGTLSAVIGAIERGGGASAAAYDHSTDELLGAMWGRSAAKGERPREGIVKRCKRCLAQWHPLRPNHKRTLVAHYVGTIRANSKVIARFGELSGVVVEQWLGAARSKHEAGAAIVRTRLADERRMLRAELDPLEVAIRRARAEQRRCWRWAFPPTEPPSRTDPAGEFRARSAVALLDRAARPLRSRLNDLLAAGANLAAQPSLGNDLDALTAACEPGTPPGLADPAERAIRSAHRAWHGLGEQLEAAELVAC